MCNSFEQQIAWKAYCEMMQMMAWRMPTTQTEIDLPSKAVIRISDTAAAMLMPEPGVVELTAMRFSYPPEGGRGPVFNVRSEGRDYTSSKRCIIPASSFFEFTDAVDKKQKRKDRWRFERMDGDWMGLPAIWKPGQGNQPPGFALPTIDPGPDVGEIHNRQIVVFPRDKWKTWLEHGDKSGFTPSPEGTFKRELDMAA